MTQLRLIKQWHRIWLVLPPIALLFFAVYIAYGESIISLLQPATYGSIYVATPQVYTDEQLVNDQMREETWLSEQMQSITGTNALLSGEFIAHTSNRLTAQLGAAGQEEQAPSSPQNEMASGDPKQTPSIQFFDEFRLRSTMRDQFRQRILDARPDDRHDSYGNAFYMLKFDVAVIPGDNTHAKAFVEIKVIPGANRLLETGTTSIPQYISRFFLDPNDNDIAAFRSLENNWIRYLNHQLNDRVKKDFESLAQSGWNQTDVSQFVSYLRKYSKLYKDNTRSEALSQQLPEDTDLGTDYDGSKLVAVLRKNKTLWQYLGDFIATRAIQSVFGIPESDVFVKRRLSGISEATSTHLFWAGEFSQYIDLSVDMASENFDAPSFNVTASTYVGDIASKSCVGDQLQGDYLFVDSLKNNQLMILMHTPTDLSLAPYNPRWDAPPFQITDEIFDLMVRTHQIESVQVGANSFFKTGCSTDYPFFIESGLLNFIKTMASYNAYSYAVLTREEPKAIARVLLNHTSREANVAAGDTSSAKLNSEAAREEELLGVTVSSGVNGYQVPGSQIGESRFGWVLDPSILSGAYLGSRESGQPVEVSLTALLSVPAWWRRVELDIESGWLDKAGRKIDDVGAQQSRTLAEVTLPTNFDALSSIAGGIEARAPAIFASDFDQYAVMACSEVTLLIPGYRLWRNSLVTLGSQGADEVEVLPSMEGIFARFRRVAVPSIDRNQSNTGPLSVPVKLRVWTSEGVAELPKPVRISIPYRTVDTGRCEPAQSDSLLPERAQ
jgi:hypothetical protein